MIDSLKPGIHPTSIVDSNTSIDKEVHIGPFCIIGPKVKIGKGTKLLSHVRIDGPTEIGEENIIFPNAYLGAIPQDLKYNREESELIIGNKNRIRECVTMNRGTTGGGNITKVGNNCLIMAYSHLGHDTVLEDNVILSNSVNVAGHVVIEESARIGGVTGVVQFIRVGKMAFIGGGAFINKDIAPFVIGNGNPAKPKSINQIGLERKGYSSDIIREIKKAYKLVFLKKYTLEKSIKEIQKHCNTSIAEIDHFINFLKNSPNGIAR